MRIELSKRGLPCLWEQGGAGTNTGDARIIGNKYAQPKKAIYVPTRGHLSNGEHALIPIKVGDIVVEADQWRGDFSIYIKEITNIDFENEKAEYIYLNKFSSGEWDTDLAKKFVDIVDAAKSKALAYHCRSAYFVKG